MERIQLQCNCFIPWVEKIPWRRKWQPIPIFLPGKSHGQRNLAFYSPRNHTELDMTEQLTLSRFLSFLGGSDGKESASNVGDLDLIPG